MKIINKFFDNNSWSIYASLQTIIIIIIMKIGITNFNPNFSIDLKFLTLASLISMMESKLLLPKLIYSFFLCLLTWSKKNFYINTFFTILATFIIHFIPYNNKIHKLFINNRLLSLLLWIGIIIWLLYFIYKIIYYK